MASVQNGPLLQMETTCGTLLYELQIIWDEVGESETDRDKMLLELERECLEVYRRKVDQANRSRAQLRQAIAHSEAELAAICSAMGERPVHIRQTEQKAGSLKEELDIIHPQLDEMRKRKSEKKNQFLEVIGKIQKVSAEIYVSTGYDDTKTAVDENDLSRRKLEDLQTELEALEKEKSDRLSQIKEHLSVLSSLCSVLGVDFKETMQVLHPNLAGSELSHCLSIETLQQLKCAINSLQELKLGSMQRLQDLGAMLLGLWDLMDTPVEEQQKFQSVTCNIAASEDELTDTGMLSADFIKYVEAEVSRLEELKSSKMKELVLKKRSELEEICRKTHLVPDTDGETEPLIAAIESGALDPSSVLEQIEIEVSKVKEEAYSRKEILERVEKWLSAREEEEWLEQYNMDGNRYNAGRGAHLTLKRAEKARTLVNKLPGMVETLAAKVLNWENERGVQFMYDGIRLLSMLEEYLILRQEKEQDKKRQREQKKLQGQLIAEQEALFGSKPSPLKSVKKPSRRMSMGGGNNNRRLSLVGNMHQTPRPDSSLSAKATPNSRPFSKDDHPASLSAARRALDIANFPVKNFSFNSRESEPTPARRPFSPISCTASLKTNTDLLDDHNILQHDLTKHPKPFSKTEPFQKTVTSNEENWTPNVKSFSSIPSTPSTVSVHMQTLMTPALSYVEEVRRHRVLVRGNKSWFCVAFQNHTLKESHTSMTNG